MGDKLKSSKFLKIFKLNFLYVLGDYLIFKKNREREIEKQKKSVNDILPQLEKQFEKATEKKIAEIFIGIKDYIHLNKLNHLFL